MNVNDRDRILRLLAYRNILQRFKSLGFIRVFSDNIAEALGISSSLVRKDFGMFGISGTQKGGYHIDHILKRIHEIIGFAETQKVVVVGTGRVGQALIHYSGLKNAGIEIIAGFDSDPAKVDIHSEVPVFPVDRLKDFIITNEIQVAIISVPETVALEIFGLLCDAGIKGILNFTPVKMKGTEEVVVVHINIDYELTNLIYMVNHQYINNKVSQQVIH